MSIACHDHSPKGKSMPCFVFFTMLNFLPQHFAAHTVNAMPPFPAEACCRQERVVDDELQWPDM